MNQHLKELAQLKDQLGEQITKCGLNEESLGRACLLFADASWSCLQARRIKVNHRTAYAFRTVFAGSRRVSAELPQNALGAHEIAQNKHAEKCLRQWEAEMSFARNKLNAAIAGATKSDNARLSIRLMSARGRMDQEFDKRKKLILQTAQSTTNAHTLTKQMRDLRDFIEHFGEAHIVVEEGVSNLFPTHEAAQRFKSTTKSHIAAQEAIKRTESEGFAAFCRLMDTTQTDPDLEREWRAFIEEDEQSRKRGPRGN